MNFTDRGSEGTNRMSNTNVKIRSSKLSHNVVQVLGADGEVQVNMSQVLSDETPLEKTETQGMDARRSVEIQQIRCGTG